MSIRGCSAAQAAQKAPDPGRRGMTRRGINEHLPRWI